MTINMPFLTPKLDPILKLSTHEATPIFFTFSEKKKKIPRRFLEVAVKFATRVLQASVKPLTNGSLIYLFFGEKSVCLKTQLSKTNT